MNFPVEGAVGALGPVSIFAVEAAAGLRGGGLHPGGEQGLRAVLLKSDGNLKPVNRCSRSQIRNRLKRFVQRLGDQPLTVDWHRDRRRCDRWHGQRFGRTGGRKRTRTIRRVC